MPGVNQTCCFPTALTAQKNKGTQRIPKWKNYYPSGITTTSCLEEQERQPYCAYFQKWDLHILNNKSSRDADNIQQMIYTAHIMSDTGQTSSVINTCMLLWTSKFGYKIICSEELEQESHSIITIIIKNIKNKIFLFITGDRPSLYSEYWARKSVCILQWECFSVTTQIQCEKAYLLSETTQPCQQLPHWEENCDTFNSLQYFN